MAAEIEKAYAEVAKVTGAPVIGVDVASPEITEVERTVRTRRVQRFFRQAVLVGYDYRCALSGMSIPDLLIASHIIPWKDDLERRADPTNGIALNAIYDRAFDQGYIAFEDEYCVMFSRALHHDIKPNECVANMFNIEGKRLSLPDRFIPDMEAVRYHRDNIYKQ